MTTSQDDEVRPVAPRPGLAPVALGRRVVRDVRATASRRDLSVAAAELTYFAGIALVPWLLLGAWSLTWWPWAQDAAARLATTRALVPEAMGARPSFDALVAAGTSLGLLGALLTLLPATFYGEGVRRGCLSLLPVDDRFTGWRARLTLAPLLLLLPLIAWFLLEVAHRLVPLAPADGWGELSLRVVIGFVALWWALTLPLAWAYVAVAPRHVSVLAALVGGTATASFLAGFLHGFQLFLTIPVDVGLPFGGLSVVGGVVAVGLWLFVLHLVVLVGWLVTVSVDAHLRERVA